jgi:hypothetical protein
MFSSLLHLMLSLSISYPYLIKFQEMMKHQMGGGGGCHKGPTGHDFPDNSNISFQFFTMRTGPVSKCEDRSSSQIGWQVRTWTVLSKRFSPLVRNFNSSLMAILMGQFSLGPDWKLVLVFSQLVRTTQHWSRPVLCM